MSMSVAETIVPPDQMRRFLAVMLGGIGIAAALAWASLDSVARHSHAGAACEDRVQDLARIVRDRPDGDGLTADLADAALMCRRHDTAAADRSLGALAMRLR
jgi:hypothetical protein